MIEKKKQQAATKSPEGWGTGKEYAAHRKALGLSGTTPAAVSQAKSGGRISPPDERGLYCFEQADREWAANTKSQHRGPEAPVAQAPTPAQPPPTTPPANFAAQGSTPDRRHWDAVKVYWEAEDRRMDVQKKAGDLIEREQATSYVAKLFRGVRDQLLSIPPRLRLDLANASDPAAVEELLRAELYRALQEPDFGAGITAA